MADVGDLFLDLEISKVVGLTSEDETTLVCSVGPFVIFATQRTIIKASGRGVLVDLTFSQMIWCVFLI